MRSRRASRRSIAGRLSTRTLGVAAAGLAVAATTTTAAMLAQAAVNPALAPKDLAAGALPSGFAGELRKTQGENCVFDYDRDGVLDVFLSTHGVGWRLLKGTADGRFVETERFPATDRHGCAVGDFGGVTASGAYTGPDGRLDIYAGIGACQGTCTSPFPKELWLQRPDGTYVPPDQDARSATAETGNKPNAGSDAAKAFGLADEHGRSREPIALDVNRDGLMDIFLGSDLGVLFPSPNRLFINRNGRFVEQPLPGGRTHTEVGSVCSTAADYDGDGWTDLVNCPEETYGKLQVYRNQGGKLGTVTDQLGLGEIPDAKDVEFADLNGDGRLDLVLVRWSWVEVRLNRANTFGTVDYARKIDGGMELAVGDADGDGLEDVYAVLLHNGAGGGRGDDLLLRNTGRTDAEGGLELEEVPIPQARQGNGDTVQAIPNWGGTNRAAFLVNNGKWTEDGPWQLIFLTGPSTGPPRTKSGTDPDPGPERRPKPGEPEPPPPEPDSSGTLTPQDAGGAGRGSEGTAPGDETAGGQESGADGKGGKVAFTVAQLRINQRISQAAVRRVNALEAIVEGRPVEPAKESLSRRPAQISLTVGQLRINQRISQAALRRVKALEARLDGRSARAEVKEAGGGSVTLTARQLLINQRISQAAVRRVNALANRVARNDFRATTLARHAPRGGGGGCDCPICCGIAPGSLSAGAGAAVAAATAGAVQQAVAAVAGRLAGARPLAYSV